MSSVIFGYARVSTEQQNLDRQIDALSTYGVDKLFQEKITGIKKERPALTKMLEQIRNGDTVVVESLSRLGRSTKDLIELVELFESRGVDLISLKENIDTSSSTGRLLFTLMSAISQFERDLISERTREGLKAAKARGRSGGRPKANAIKVEQALKLYYAGQHTLKEITELTGITKATLYRKLKES